MKIHIQRALASVKGDMSTAEGILLDKRDKATFHALETECGRVRGFCLSGQI